MKNRIEWRLFVALWVQKQYLGMLLVCMLPNYIFAEGTLQFNNLQNTNRSLFANSSGLVFFQEKPLETDLNFELTLMLSDSTNVTTFRWLLKDGIADGIALGGGYFADPQNEILKIPWANPGDTVVGRVAAWNGLEESFLAAGSHGDAVNARYFGIVLGDESVQPSLTTMSALNVDYIPEPTTFTLSALGLGSLFLLSRTRKRRHESRAPCQEG